MEELNQVQKLAIFALPVLFAITVHETAHGWVAKQLGDNTAYAQGRITLNPIKHIDLVGTVIVPITLFFLGGLLFGWAKPVPVTWRNLHNPRRDIALVAIAGPGSNLVMAILWALVIQLGLFAGDMGLNWFALPLVLMGQAGVLINAVLMILNLLPILPLDGGRVLSSLLPPKLAEHFAKLEPWGLFIILGLLFLGLLGTILRPGIQLVQNLSFTLVGLN